MNGTKDRRPVRVPSIVDENKSSLPVFVILLHIIILRPKILKVND